MMQTHALEAVAIPAETFAIERPQTITDQVYLQLKSYCLAKRLGERVVERELTEKLQVSRTPVREALSRLQSEGFLVSHGRSYRIPIFSKQDVRNMTQIRSLLEVEAARQAASHLADTGLTKMYEALQSLAEAHQLQDVEAFNRNNLAFRQAWAQRLENPLLLTALNRTITSLQLVRFRALSLTDVRAFSLESDYQLVAAIAEHDIELAARTQQRKAEVMCELIIQALPRW